MYKIISCWSAPASDVEEDFEDHYWSTHIPLAEAVPLLGQLVLTRTSEGLGDEDSPYYRVAELVFDSREALDESLLDPAWPALRADAEHMVEKYAVTLTTGLGTAIDRDLSHASGPATDTQAPS